MFANCLSESSFLLRRYPHLLSNRQAKNRNGGDVFTKLSWHAGGGSSNSYKTVDSSDAQNLGIPFTGTGLRLVFTLTTTNTYTLRVINNASGATNTVSGTLGGTAGSTIDSIALFNFNAGASPDHDCLLQFPPNHRAVNPSRFGFVCA